MPDEAGLGGVAHPGEDAGAGVEELCEAGFVHGAEGFVVGELRLADEIGEVGDGAVTLGDDVGIERERLREPSCAPQQRSCSAQSSLTVSQSFSGIMAWIDSSVGMETLPISVLNASVKV